jgi:hypothetical protein
MIGHVAQFYISFLRHQFALAWESPRYLPLLCSLLPHDIDCNRVERCLDIRCITFLDHLDTRAAVLSDFG